jgi:hypothetical protein
MNKKLLAMLRMATTVYFASILKITSKKNPHSSLEIFVEWAIPTKNSPSLGLAI